MLWVPIRSSSPSENIFLWNKKYFSDTLIAPDKWVSTLYFSYFSMKTRRYSLEVPWRGASNEYHNIRFHGEIRKISAKNMITWRNKKDISKKRLVWSCALSYLELWYFSFRWEERRTGRIKSPAVGSAWTCCIWRQTCSGIFPVSSCCWDVSSGSVICTVSTH